MTYNSGSEYPPLNTPSLTPPTPERGPSNSYIFLTVLLVALAFTGGWLGNSFLNSVPSSARPYSGDIWKAWSDIDQYYVDKGAINHQQMAYAMLNAMVGTLGDTGHSRFLTPTQVAQLNQELNNTGIVGIGVYIHYAPLATGTGQATIIDSTIPNSPAQKSGLLPGDQILTVNGQDIAKQTPEQITSLITGSAGTSVTLTVQRQGSSSPLSFTLTRAKVTPTIVNYFYFATSHIGYVQIDGFDTGATKQLTAALKSLQAQGMKGIILDLRDNGGGLVNEALGVAGNFLPNGATVVYEKDSSGISPDKVDDTTAPGGAGLHLTLPMVVLVNGNTASASEIVTGALQDNRNVPVIGERTFGTDTVLDTFPLSDGSELLLGVKQFLTPNKHQFKPGVGLEPSQPVTLPTNAFPLTPLALQEANLTEADVLSGNTKLSNDVQLIDALKAVQLQLGA